MYICYVCVSLYSMTIWICLVGLCIYIIMPVYTVCDIYSEYTYICMSYTQYHYNQLNTYSICSKLLQKQLVTTKYSAQQVVKEVTAAVAASQGTQQQRHEDSDSEDDEEFGAASTYANYQPAKCRHTICVEYLLLSPTEKWLVYTSDALSIPIYGYN